MLLELADYYSLLFLAPFLVLELFWRARRYDAPGSIALLYDDPDGTPHLFTGDSLFPGGVGKTWSPEDFETLVEDVDTKVFGRLPDETWFYPGHGADSTLGEQRPHVGEWRARGW